MKRLLATAMLVAFASSPAWAQTYVCGNIVNTTWTLAGSPYLVTCDIVVSGLTIEPGVSVIFLGNYLFEMAGTLTAIGTTSDSIRFTRPDSVSGWKGLFFNSSEPGSELAYCVIERATSHGINIDRSQVTIHDCAIRLNTNSTNSGGGIYLTAPSDPLTLQHCTINNNTVSGSGGGIRTTSPLTLQECTISDNTASGGYGGGINTTSTLTLQECTISDNTASGGYGGGLFTSAPMDLRHCTISGNYANSGYHGYGGGIYSSASIKLYDCHVCSNVAAALGHPSNGTNYAYGGGLCATADTATVIMERCVVDSNTVSGGMNGGIGYYTSYCYGAGVFSQSVLGACNTEIASNQALGRSTLGSGLYVADRRAVLLNCTIASNQYCGVGSYAGRDSVTILNSIVFFNNIIDIPNGTAGVQFDDSLSNVTYSDVQGDPVYPGEGNIRLNPFFASPTNPHIVVGSPCIDAGDSIPRYEEPLTRYNDVCFPPSLGTIRNDMGQDGGRGACSGDTTYWTPVQLSLVSADVTSDGVKLAWFRGGSGSDVATVYRSFVGGEWTRIGETSVDGTGYLRYTDPIDPTASRVGYRLGIIDEGIEGFYGETWADLPARSTALAFALDPVRPNPSRGGALTVRFSLPTAAPARLELLDVAGRRIASHEVGIGQHTLDLGRDQRLAPGLYLVRLTQGANTRTTRVAVLR